MKINLKSENLIYLFVLAVLSAIILATVVVYFQHIRLFPVNWGWEFKSYDNFHQAFREWVLLFIISSLGLFFSLYLSKKAGPGGVNYIYICPLCEEPQRINNKQDAICNKCGVKMVPLKGYYDKDKKEES